MATLTSIPRDTCFSTYYPDVSTGPYGYDPSLGAGIAFSVLFGLSMIAHLAMSVASRRWWQTVFAVGALTETIGWAGRSWSSHCPYQNTPFLIQIVTLIIAPAFFTAGTYVILGRLIVTFDSARINSGSQKSVSPLSPSMYLYIFCTADLLSLLIQAVGGGMAAAAFAQNPPADTAIGTHIMVAGIIFQLAAVVVFSVLFAWVITVALSSKASADILQNRKTRLVIAGTTFSVVCVIIRSVFRTIELLDGWSGYIAHTQRYFIVLDGVMMFLAVAVFNFCSPGWASIRGYADVQGHKKMYSKGQEQEMNDLRSRGATPETR